MTDRQARNRRSVCVNGKTIRVESRSIRPRKAVSGSIRSRWTVRLQQRRWEPLRIAAHPSYAGWTRHGRLRHTIRPKLHTIYRRYHLCRPSRNHLLGRQHLHRRSIARHHRLLRYMSQRHVRWTWTRTMMIVVTISRRRSKRVRGTARDQ